MVIDFLNPFNFALFLDPMATGTFLDPWVFSLLTKSEFLSDLYDV